MQTTKTISYRKSKGEKYNEICPDEFLGLILKKFPVENMQCACVCVCELNRKPFLTKFEDNELNM